MWAIAISIAALAATVANFLFTQWRTDKRELENWRRNELLRLTSLLLELSSRRQSELLADLSNLEGTGRSAPAESDPWELTREMQVTSLHLYLLDDRLAAQASAVCKLHQEAERQYYPDQDPYKDIDKLIVEPEILLATHRQLVNIYRQSINRKWKDNV